jgi:LuxR family maltose regulon positive regulatory protein
MTQAHLSPALGSTPASVLLPARSAGTLDMVLHTKFFIPPPRAQRVLRARLLTPLRTPTLPPVTLVTAPAGYGKTTLVADWITRDARRAAWVTLDAADDDPGAFWTSVATALSTVQPAAGAHALDLLRQPQPLPLPTILTILINDLTAHLAPDAAGRPVLLVLDDYHVITHRAIHELVMTLIEHLPPHLRLVLTSRGDPPLRLGRLRVRERLLEIRASDLAFEEPETAAFLTETMGLALVPAAATTLTTRTEGWVAALQLAALSLRHQTDPAAFLAGFGGGHRYLLGYLVEEVFSQQPPAVQTFLLATSVLERMCADLCAAVLAPASPDPAAAGAGSPQTLLEELDAANLFVVALDAGGQWYRYHPLFAEMLRHQLRHVAPAEERIYRQRACAWLTHAGYEREAVGQALAGQDWAAAAGLIEQCAEGAWQRGELGLLAGWLDALPPVLRHERPRLSLLQALLLMMDNQYAPAEAWLAEVAQGLAREEAAGEPAAPARDRAALRGRAAVIQAQVVRILHNDLVQSGSAARQALDALPPNDLAWRAMALANLGSVAYAGSDLESVVAHYGAAGTLAVQAGFHLLTWLAPSRVSAALYDLGRLAAARACCSEARQRARATDNPDLPGLCHIDWADALVCYEVGDLAEADRLLVRASALAAQERQAEAQGFAEITRSWVLLAQGDSAGALQALATATAILAPPGGGARVLEMMLAAWRATVLLVGPPVPGPAATADIAGALQPDGSAPAPALPLAHWSCRAWHLLPARVDLQQGDPAAAHAYLESLCARVEAVGARGLWITALALDALALDALGRPAAARAALGRAVTLGSSEGHIRAILDAGPAIGALLDALAQEVTRTADSYPERLAYINRLRAAGGRAAPSPPRPSSPPGPLAEPLTSRELAILRLLAAGCSNQEIADQLIIGVSTVKWYLRTIYGKLDSASRTQADARARTRGLIR